jgi:EXLDI family protein
VPNKTFYVAEDDMPLFQRAQDLAGGNLSAAITQGVRRFVELQEGIMEEGHKEVTVTVGAPGMQRAKRFVGSRLVAWRAPVGENERFEGFSVYRTAGERLAVHTRRIVNWQRFKDEDWRRWSDRNWEDPDGTWNEITEATLDVYNDIEHLIERVPPEVAVRVRHAIGTPTIEVLDI